MESLIACLVTVTVAIPVSFWMARTCLRGIVRYVTGPRERGVLGS
jgi:hypothetical protein